MYPSIVLCIVVVLSIVMLVSIFSALVTTFMEDKAELTFKLLLVSACAGIPAWAIVNIMPVLQAHGRL